MVENIFVDQHDARAGAVVVPPAGANSRRFCTVCASGRNYCSRVVQEEPTRTKQDVVVAAPGPVASVGSASGAPSGGDRPTPTPNKG